MFGRGTFTPQVKHHEFTNRRARLAAASKERRASPGKIRAYAADGQFVISVNTGVETITLRLSPEHGEQHLRECLEAMETLRPSPAPELTDVEPELFAESLAAMKPTVIPAAAGDWHLASKRQRDIARFEESMANIGASIQAARDEQTGPIGDYDRILSETLQAMPLLLGPEDFPREEAECP